MDRDQSSTVLHQLRLLGGADVVTLGRRTGHTVDEVLGELRHWRSSGWVVCVPSVRGAGRWRLTDAGRRRHEQVLARELDRCGGRAAVAALLPDFTALNLELLELCSAWQLDPAAARRAPLVRQLGRIDRRADRMLEPAGAVVPRLRCYRSRLGAARRRVEAGQDDWLARPGIDSYHSVWFELHEDLLATLGRTRRDDRPSEPPSEPRIGVPGARRHDPQELR